MIYGFVMVFYDLFMVSLWFVKNCDNNNTRYTMTRNKVLETI